MYHQAIDVLTQLRSALDHRHLRLDQVVRTWFYLGGVLDEHASKQRYHEFNRARADFYHQVPFFHDCRSEKSHGSTYPASTAVGAEGRSIVAGAIALDVGRSDVVITPLENPQQTSACDYDSEHGSHSPKFSRALALSFGDFAVILISGTASILGSEARHTDDVVAQTHATLDNIATLISEDNLGHHGLPGLGTSFDGLGMVRVYVKHAADYAQVRAVCEKRLGRLPMIFTVADICRPELLVEIEGVAFSHG